MILVEFDIIVLVTLLEFSHRVILCLVLPCFLDRSA